jgi:hypothetical protein
MEVSRGSGAKGTFTAGQLLDVVGREQALLAVELAHPPAVFVPVV